MQYDQQWTCVIFTFFLLNAGKYWWCWWWNWPGVVGSFSLNFPLRPASLLAARTASFIERVPLSMSLMLICFDVIVNLSNLNCKVDWHPIEQRRLAQSLRRVEDALPSFALEQVDVEHLGAVLDGWQEVLVSSASHQFPLLAVDCVLHGDQAIALDPGSLDVGCLSLLLWNCSGNRSWNKYTSLLYNIFQKAIIFLNW